MFFFNFRAVEERMLEHFPLLAGHNWQALGRPILSLHAPTGRPYVNTNHCMADTSHGR